MQWFFEKKNVKYNFNRPVIFILIFASFLYTKNIPGSAARDQYSLIGNFYISYKRGKQCAHSLQFHGNTVINL